MTPKAKLITESSSNALLTNGSPQRSPLLFRARHAAVFVARGLVEAIQVFRTARAGDRLALALLVLRMRTKHFLIKLFPRWNFQREKLFGWTLECFDYYTFLTTVEIIFLKREYRFTPRAACPQIIDCGSNIGLSLLFFKREFPDATIVAFEPHPATFARLKSNVERNALAGIELHNQAVCGSPGLRALFCDPACPGSVAMSLRPECGLSQREEVAGVVLSDFVEEDVDLLKLDVEGAELEVLAELVETGKLRRIDQILVEYHPWLIPEIDGLAWLRETFARNGYSCEVRSGEPALLGTPNAPPLTLYARRDRPVVAGA